MTLKILTGAAIIAIILAAAWLGWIESQRDMEWIEEMGRERVIGY